MTSEQKPQEFPFSNEAEVAVLGSLLIDGDLLDKIADIVEPDDFFRGDYRIIFKAMLNTKSDETNQVTVAHELTKAGADFLIPALSHIISLTPSSVYVESYAKQVKNCALYRQLIYAAEAMIRIAREQSPDFGLALDKCANLVEELRLEVSIESRRLVITNARLVQTNPPRYIWNVNGKDLRLTLTEITIWGKFKNRVISELDFVPVKPQKWDDLINSLVSHSYLLEAPLDASEEQQLKIFIMRWFERMKEANDFSDLAVGRHIIKEVKGQDYYFFKSTPLLNWLKKEFKKAFNSEDLWIFVHKWYGIRHKMRVKTPNGSTPADLWGIPMNFLKESEEPVKEDVQTEMVPDNF